MAFPLPEPIMWEAGKRYLWFLADLLVAIFTQKVTGCLNHFAKGFLKLHHPDWYDHRIYLFQLLLVAVSFQTLSFGAFSFLDFAVTLETFSVRNVCMWTTV